MNVQEFAALKARVNSAVDRNSNYRATVNELLDIIGAGLDETPEPEQQEEQAHANTGAAGDPPELPSEETPGTEPEDAHNEPVPEGEGEMSEDDTAVPADDDAPDGEPDAVA